MNLQLPSYLWAACAAWGSRGVFLVCRFIQIILLVRILPASGYAALALLTGLEGWFLLFDFGLGASAQLFFSSEKAQGREGKGIIKTAVVLGSCCFFVGVFFLGILQKPLASFFLGKVLPFSEATLLFFVAGSFLLLQALGSLAQKIWIAKEKGALFSLGQAMACLLSLGLLFMGKSTSLLFFCCCLLGPQSIFSLGCFVSLGFLADWKLPLDRRVWQKAKSFFCFSLLAAFVTLSDALIIPKILEVSDIIEYNILCKFFGIASFGYSALLQNFSPKCTEYLTLSLHARVQELLHRFCFFSAVGVVVYTIGIHFFSSFIERLFLVVLSPPGIYCFGFYLVLRVFCDFYAMALQSVGHLRLFFFITPVQALLSISLQYLFGSLWGVPGILLGLACSYLATVVWLWPREYKRIFLAKPCA